MAKTAKVASETEPLTGKALLQKVKALGNVSRRETAKACGYYSLSKNNQIRVNLTEFYDAVLAAKGIALTQGSKKNGRGREASYRTSVHKNGTIVIGSNYTESMGLKPGDEFEIRLGSKHIHLIQVDSKDALDLDDDEQE